MRLLYRAGPFVIFNVAGPVIPVGARLREVRKERGLVMEDLPWSHSSTARYECGQNIPSIAKLQEFCEILSVSPQELLGSEEAWLLRSPIIREAADDLLNLTLAQRAQVLDVLQGLAEVKL